MSLKKLFMSMLISLVSFIGVAQIQYGGTPASWIERSSYDSIAGFSYDLDIARSMLGKPGKDATAFTFAEPIMVNLDILKHGTHSILDDGTKVWRIKLRSDGAYSLNVIFSRFLLPEGGGLFVYTPDKKIVRGAYTFLNNKGSGTLAIQPVPGEEIVLEYNQPEDVEFQAELVIDQLSHDFLGVFAAHKDGQFGASGDCNIDINCDEGAKWQIDKRAVCRMVIGGTELCTGTLVNNTNQDQEPYILTANHCINTQNLADNTVFVFNYESKNCNGEDGSVAHSISGAELLSTKNKTTEGYLDFTLVRLSVDIPEVFEPYFAGWDVTGSLRDTVVAIHHPNGDVKKVSGSYQELVTATFKPYSYDESTFWLVKQWAFGTTEGGSSGGALFDKYHRVIGTLSGGWADCESPINDYYQKLSVSYDKYYQSSSTQLKPWLDPKNTGTKILDGYDPNTGGAQLINKKMLSNWTNEAVPVLYEVNQGSGYISGNNSFGDLVKADFFSLASLGTRDYIEGVYVLFGKATGDDNVDIDINLYESNGGEPGESFQEASLKLKEVKDAAEGLDYVYYEFENPVYVNRSFFAGIVLPTNVGDTVALITTEDTEEVVEENFAWELQFENIWKPYSDTDYSWGLTVSHAIFPVIGNLNSIKQKVREEKIKLFPNPANEQVTIMINTKEQGVVFVYNSLGILIAEKALHSNSVSLDVSEWSPGIYIIQCRTKNGAMNNKLLVE
jgi:V8-like Glu-specific endopeptidase